MGQLTFQATLGGSVNLAGPNTASTTTFTLPAADGTNGQALTTNGSGTLAFATVGASAATPTALGTVYGTTNSSNTALGYQVGLGSSTFNTAIGYQAYTNLGAGNGNNTAVGGLAGYSVTSGGVDAFGWKAGYSTTTGGLNAAFGPQSLQDNTTGSANCAFGYNALQSNTTASQSTAVGYQAAYSNTGSYNSAFGYVSLKNNTTGEQNSAFSRESLFSCTTGGNNSAFGATAGYSVTTGTDNVFVGKGAGSNLTTGSYSIYIGQGAQPSASSATSELVIGAQATGKGTGTSLIYGGSGGAYQGNNSATWSVISDQRLKKNIVNNNVGLNAINSIRVCNFEYRIAEEITELPQNQAIPKTGVQLGAIAQELQAILPDCVKQESTGVLSVNTDNLTWYMINAIKELKAEVDSLKSQLQGN